MAILLSNAEGCILDQNAAVLAAYKICRAPRVCCGNCIQKGTKISSKEKNGEAEHLQKCQIHVNFDESREHKAIIVDHLETVKIPVTNILIEAPKHRSNENDTGEVCEFIEKFTNTHTSSSSSSSSSSSTDKNTNTCSSISTSARQTSNTSGSTTNKNTEQDANTTSKRSTMTTTRSDNIEAVRIIRDSDEFKLPSKFSLHLKRGFFSIILPFMMDSQFEKVEKFLSSSESSNHSPSKSSHSQQEKMTVKDVQYILAQQKKRKRKVSSEVGDKNNMENERLWQVHTSLVTLAKIQEIFHDQLSKPLNNNKLSRECAQLDLLPDCFHNFLLAWDGTPKDSAWREPLVISQSGCVHFDACNLIHRKVEYKESEASVILIDNSRYILPPYSTFLVSNYYSFSHGLYKQIVDKLFDLIVIDPPWENKSVKRKKSYDMIDEFQLKCLPLQDMMQHSCLVALWVTNNERIQEFAVQELFSAWNLCFVGKWHWLKVTQTGDMVASLYEGHKKPYEVLLLGRYRNTDTENELSLQDPPTSYVLLSIPCSIHSKKVSLSDALSAYLPSKPHCLELFARNLWPGWTSWGREVLKHQNMIFYEEAI